MFYTPNDVTKYFLDNIPQNVSHVLEPSVGVGNLIIPLLSSPAHNVTKSVCIDVNAAALKIFLDKLPLKSLNKTKIVNDDFLDWSNNKKNVFDLILANPPFSSRNEDLYRIDVKDVGLRRTEKKDFLVSIEDHFLIRSLRLLKENGRLVAILPSSIITSERSTWLRQFLFQQGSIISVRELSNFLFRNVECKTFLMIYQKTKATSVDTVLLNDTDDDSVVLTNRQKLLGDRMDFSYHKARKILLHNQAKKSLSWKKLGDLVDVSRGKISSPTRNSAVHTTDFHKTRWTAKGNCNNYVHLGKVKGVQKTDILAMRVGRNLASSFSTPTHKIVGKACSDCMLLIRPKIPENQMAILCGIRSIMVDKQLQQLILRGSGAKYVTIKSLSELEIPINLNEVYPDLFENFCKAIRSNDRLGLHDIEKEFNWIIFQTTSAQGSNGLNLLENEYLSNN